MESSDEMTTDNQTIKPKMAVTGTVTRISLAGALFDIGVNRPAVMHISQIIPPNADEPIRRVEDVLQIGQSIECWVRRVKEDHIELTMFRPLDLDWKEIKKGMTVKGKVVRLEKFGAFVEIGAERPGLVHVSEMAYGYVRTPSDVVKEGDEVEAQVLDIDRRKKQIKLSMKALQPEPQAAMESVKQESYTDNRPARDKRRPKSGRAVSEIVEEIPVTATEAELDQTAMQIAWDQAQQKARSRSQEEKSRRSKSISKEQEEILSRTLETKVRSS